MSKKKFYAIKRGKKGTKNVILESWDECSKLVLGFDSEYKGFKTREEAEEYLGISIKSSDSIDNEIQEEISIDNIEEVKKVAKQKKKKTKSNRNKETLVVELPKDLYNAFSNKCAKLNMTEDIVIKNMIMEWII